MSALDSRDALARARALVAAAPAGTLVPVAMVAEVLELVDCGAVPALDDPELSAEQLAERFGVSATWIKTQFRARRVPEARHRARSWRCRFSAFAAFWSRGDEESSSADEPQQAKSTQPTAGVIPLRGRVPDLVALATGDSNRRKKAAQ